MVFLMSELVFYMIVHRVSKDIPPLACYNFDAREWIYVNGF